MPSDEEIKTEAHERINPKDSYSGQVISCASFCVGAVWMRDRLMPLINKPDDKFEFVEWIVINNWVKRTSVSEWLHAPRGTPQSSWEILTTEQLYQKFLSRNKEPES